MKGPSLVMRMTRAVLSFSKIFLIILAGVLLALVITLGYASTQISQIDLTSYVNQHGTQFLGRKVSASSIIIHNENPIRLEMNDIALASPQWGSEPDMVRIEHVSANINRTKLWQGILEYNNLKIAGLDILLERDAAGIGNWRLDGKPRNPDAPPPDGGLSLLPKNRTQFPNLLDANITNSLVRYRTSSGKILRIAAKDLQFTAADGNSPVNIILNGSYNDLPAVLTINGASYHELRRGNVPYNIDLTIASQHSKLHFNGMMMEPLDVEGADGSFHVQASELGELLNAMDTEATARLPFSLKSHLTRKNSVWDLTGAVAKLGNSDFQGTIQLVEGERGKGDLFNLDLFSELVALKPLFDGFDTGAAVEKPEFKKEIANKLNLKLKSEQVTYKNYLFSNAVLHLLMNSGTIRLPEFTFGFADGAASMRGSIENTGENIKLDAEASLEQADSQKFLQNIGFRNPPIHGSLNMYVELHSSAPSLEDAIKHGNGGAVMMMKNGSIARDVLEKASINIKNIFRDAKGQAQLRCMLGVITLQKGIGTISPLKLRTSEANFYAGGKIDLNQKNLDLLLESDPETTGSLALDIPLRISGNFSDINVLPAFGATVKKTDASASLPEKLKSHTQKNVCR